ncbi:[protein-PII] uridylyltransferase [Dactylosporangium matsuzakiense]|uniref:[protein-PII] uridylyltransferase n=1 Tax=Dactylosporangium matsuzakiense TaxID=53360 RepID=UPI0021C47AFF|nr:[protein-PII] uridylyltransferase [Dactylosporangium matsuzakiense]UWZ46327.1 [protein-PII] uridylyltransferase [Dactylosporangium matsuzakiense]
MTQTSAPAPVLSTGAGADARAQRSDAIDEWLEKLFFKACDGTSNAALVAVGGLGRQECAPRSDLDLVLLHPGGPGDEAAADEIGSRLWYQIWDAKFALDHSTRSPGQALDLARQDLKVALGLLDARLIAGNADLLAGLHAAAVTQWRREARHLLPALRTLTAQRWKAHGELAFLLEGDVKESRGGLRDFGVLRAIGFAGVADGPRPAVRGAHRTLLDVRDTLHAVRGRRVDRLLAQDRDEVAELLGLGDRDEVLRRIAESARTIAYASDDAWRAVERWSAPSTRGHQERRPLARDVVEQRGEVVLARAAVTPRPEPSLPLRVAAAAARADLPISHATLEWLGGFAGPMPDPWPAPARAALLTLLGSGPSMIEVWEACDRYGLVVNWLPEWARVRSLPQHNPVHLFTVDRHLVETARQAAGLTRDVDRPDLLVLCGLLHDIGKGLPGDHSIVGAPIAAAVAERLGLDAADVAQVEKVVRLHLLIPDTATRRDLSDPQTIATVAGAVGDASTLSLLHALARADAAATGPAAWSDWKGRLIGDLVRHVDRALDTGVVAPPPSPAAALTVPKQLPAVQLETDLVSVTATDRRGLLAAVAGCLSLHRLDVVTADTATVDGVARMVCAVQPRYGGEVDREAVTSDLRRAVTGDLPVAERLAARERSTRRSGAGLAPPRVVWQPSSAATDATVLELRATDTPGLLFRVASALEDLGADVRSTRISTLGGEVVDAFYLAGELDADARSRVAAAVLSAATAA